MLRRYRRDATSKNLHFKRKGRPLAPRLRQSIPARRLRPR
jgi:hypothetical protein